jgi:hypothetical protein
MSDNNNDNNNDDNNGNDDNNDDKTKGEDQNTEMNAEETKKEGETKEEKEEKVEDTTNYDLNGGFAFTEEEINDAIDQIVKENEMTEIVNSVVKSERLKKLLKRHLPHHEKQMIRIVGACKSYARVAFGDKFDSNFSDIAPVTTCEMKYAHSPHIAEYWATISSISYHLVFLVLFVPYQDWYYLWQLDGRIPIITTITVYILFLVGTTSALYHSTLWEGIGCIDCSLAIIGMTMLTLACINVDIKIYALILATLTLLYFKHLKYATAISVVLGALLVPYIIIQNIIRNNSLGWATSISLFVGTVCFMLDRARVFPEFAHFHSIWHVLSGLSGLFGLLNVVCNGPHDCGYFLRC